ncbi:MAG: ABC transporter arginine-binding protein 1 [Chloroflexi bacterium]|nr:ABC transporter arginine-binding protein 1 [Chloroflexota bacterium]
MNTIMKRNPLLQNSTIRQKIINYPFAGILCVFFLALVLQGCTILEDLNPTAINTSPTATPLSENPLRNLEQIQERGVLVVGTAITEPFEYHHAETGELIGFDVDTAEYIAENLGVELEWVEMSFANLIPTLRDRKVDIVIAAMYIKPDREEVVDFSTPYIDTGLVIVVRPELEEEVKTVQDLAGLKVGVKIGATGAKLAQDLVSQGIPLEKEEYKTTFDSFLDLEVGRVDVVFNDYLNTLVYMKDSGTDLKIVTNEAGEVNFLSQVGLGIAVHQGNQALLEAINTSLAEMRQDGMFERLSENWLDCETDQ